MPRLQLPATILVTAFTLLLPAAARARITISPLQSMAGATEKYILRVPTESKVATIAAELDVPGGVIVEAVAVPAGWKYEAKRKDDRIMSMLTLLVLPVLYRLFTRDTVSGESFG